MRMIVPPAAYRREIDKHLVAFFRGHRSASFSRAVSSMCRYYNVKRPRIEWYEYLDWGKTAGKTFEDGRIHLVHPENWKRGRIYNSERMWVNMIYHEMGHFLFWTDAERKADAFMRRMITGLRAPNRRVRSRPRTGMLSARRASASGERTTRARIGRSRVAAAGRAKRPRRSRAR
ncbi:MAG TPA: hypothetical protein VIX12_01585 [Candidatus Binataceae bacterium]